MIIKLYPENPNEKSVRQIVDLLRSGGVIVYPTDTVYALGCSLGEPKAIEKMRKIKGKNETEMSIVCADLSEVSDYAKVDNAAFKILKRNMPGPFTFILPASSRISEKVMRGRKTIGIRVPDHPIVQAIVRELGLPMVTTSVRTRNAEDAEEGYYTHPELIHERYTPLGVDVVVDGGLGDNVASTIVDATEDEVKIMRQGLHELEE